MGLGQTLSTNCLELPTFRRKLAAINRSCHRRKKMESSALQIFQGDGDIVRSTIKTSTALIRWYRTAPLRPLDANLCPSRLKAETSRITRQGSREANSLALGEMQARRNTAIIPGIIRVAKSRASRVQGKETLLHRPPALSVNYRGFLLFAAFPAAKRPRFRALCRRRQFRGSTCQRWRWCAAGVTKRLVQTD